MSTTATTAVAVEGGKAGTAKERKPVGWKPVALDGGYGWVVVLGSFLIHVFADGFVYSFGVIAESLVREFDASNAQVSTVLSLLTGLMLATGPLASAICNRIGCRITTIIGAVIGSIGCAISYYATSMNYLIGSVGIVMGLGFGLMYCPAIVIVTMYFEKRRSLATGVTVCGAGVGTFLFSRIISFLVVHFDWRTVFLIYSGMVLLCVPCGALYRPIEFEPIYDFDAEEEKEAEVDDAIEEDAVGEEIIPEKQKTTADLNSKHPLLNGFGAGPEPRKKLTPVQPLEEQSSEPPLQPPQEKKESKTSRHNSTNSHILQSVRRNSKSSKGRMHELRAAISSHQLPTTAAGAGAMQRFRSVGEQLHTRTGHPSTANGNASNSNKVFVSTGYLNVKDVFLRRSVKDLPAEYTEHHQRFRSVSSLQRDHRDHRPGDKERSSTKLQHQTPFASTLAVEKIDEKEEDEQLEEAEVEEVEEDSALSSASRAIEIWSGWDYGTFSPAAGGSGAPREENFNSARLGWKLLCTLGRTTKRMMDLSLLADPVYLLFAISNFLTSIGFNAPPMFFPMNAELVLGFNKLDAATTVSAYGLANLFGRITFGLICDRQLPFRWGKDCRTNRLWIYNLCLVAVGIASCFVFAIESFYVFTGYCFVFGFLISSYVCLTSVVLVDMIGVDRLTNAFGLLLFIQGIATFVGPPIAGQLYDLTKRYDWSFFFCGACLFISGAMLFAIPRIQSRRRKDSSQSLKEPSNLSNIPLMPNGGSDAQGKGKGQA